MKRRNPRASNGPNHLGLCALQSLRRLVSADDPGDILAAIARFEPYGDDVAVEVNAARDRLQVL